MSQQTISNIASLRSLVEESPYAFKSGFEILESEEHPGKIPENSLIAVDMFCGAGGLSLGFELAGFKTVLGLDYHAPSIESFLYNRRKLAVRAILGDVRQVDFRILNELVDNQHVHVLLGGLPCQGFSLNNRKRDPMDPRNHLFWYFLEAIKTLKPDVILIENVPTLRTMSKGAFIKEITRGIQVFGELVGISYEVKPPCLLNALDFGIPQNRKRIFILAHKKGLSIPWPPTATISTYRTVYDAISDLPHLEAGQESTNYDKPPLTDYQALMRKGSKKLTCHEAPRHQKSTIERIAKTKPGEPMYSKYPQRIRLSWDKPSPTIVAGGIRPQFLFGHPEQNRGLTVRECARLQSFPDWYEFKGGMVQGRVQVGNAVPPLLAKEIAICIKEAFANW